MKDFSYNTSEKLQAILTQIDVKRATILTTPISPRDELRLKWEIQIDRIHAAFVLSGKSISKTEIVKLFTTGGDKKLDSNQIEIRNFKKGFDVIVQNWLVNRKNISVRTLTNLLEITSKKSKFPANEEQTRKLLEFLQTATEHPVIVSGIALIQFLSISTVGITEDNLARMLAYMFLYKSGYDFRGLLNIEAVLVKDKLNFRAMVEKSIQSGNLTLWLEYYAQKINEELDEVIKDVESIKFHIDVAAKNFEFNERQKEILIYLDIPGRNITNRMVQKMFKVSQITASRDLAGLAALGVIFVHGKGRSVYYTKV